MTTETNHSPLPQPDTTPREPFPTLFDCGCSREKVARDRCSHFDRNGKPRVDPLTSPLPAVRFLPPRLVPLLPLEDRGIVRRAAQATFRSAENLADHANGTLHGAALLAASALALFAGTVALLACAEDEGDEQPEGGA